MRKAVAVVLAACMACFGVTALTACGGQSNSTSTSTSNAAPPNNTLIVGFDQEYPPYGYVSDDGSFTGFDLDLAQAVCEKNGWTYQAEAIDWDAKDAMIDQGQITCIWNGFTREGREENYAFTGDYMLNAQVIVVKADSEINTLSDLAGKTVITQVDSAALEELDSDQWKDLQASFKGGKVQTISDYNNAFMQLESGTVDAVACDLSIAQFQQAAKPDAYKQLDEQLSSEHYAVGFKKDEAGQALADKVTETLKQLDAEGKVKEICDKYADQGINYDNWCLA